MVLATVWNSDGVWLARSHKRVCNTYRIWSKRGAEGLAQRVNEAAARLKSDLIRKSDPAPVVRADGRVELMRWGFHSDFNPAINNARSDKLEGGMWPDVGAEDIRCNPAGLLSFWRYDFRSVPVAVLNMRFWVFLFYMFYKILNIWLQLLMIIHASPVDRA